jgi:GNAT superfamily N-acetyltransferase
MSLNIRRIRADEWQRLRALRLHALADAPMAFASTLAREDTFSDDVWRERAASGAAGVDRVTFIAAEGGRWVGLATGLLADQPIPTLVGMFVDTSARQRGIGAELVEQVAGWARERGGDRLVLWVTADNHAAIALYRRCGFKPTGATKPVAHTPACSEQEMMRKLLSLPREAGEGGERSEPGGGPSVHNQLSSNQTKRSLL